jgi:hypothetical protein
MSKLDHMRSEFSVKLERTRQHHREGLEQELAELRQAALAQPLPALPFDLAERLRQSPALTSSQPGRAALPRYGLLDVGSSGVLQELDEAFMQAFELSRYFDSGRLRYPTVLCDTLEEFFQPFLANANLSTQMRQVEVDRLVAEAQEAASKTNGGGIFGVDLPGQGCYLNGWLFAYGTEVSPRQALQESHLRQAILSTAIHEKLGHGFLTRYSALGGVKTELGLVQIEIAGRFGLRMADDPVASLRREQARAVFIFSQLLEEGWATWVQSWMSAHVLGVGEHPRHNLEKVVAAVQTLPQEPAELAEARESLLRALAVLFIPKAHPMARLQQAAKIVDLIGYQMDEYFGAELNQPLRYAVGELLFDLAASRLGPVCMPYVALIAGNVTLDPSRISLADLVTLLQEDARLHPDARLAALAHLELTNPGDVHELAALAQSQLSLSVPVAFRS